MEGEETEEPGGGLVQSPVGPREDGAQVGVGVEGGECVEASVASPQVIGDGAQGEDRVEGGTGGDDGQGQRQTSAQPDDVGGGIRFGVETFVSEAAGEHLVGLRW